MAADPARVLAVDPGREKCGLAVVDRRQGVLARAIVSTPGIGDAAAAWIARYAPELLVTGAGTAPASVHAQLSALPLPLVVVDEAHTTLRARQRYFDEQPPRGWRRLIPRSLQTPPVPVDDYAAILIGEEYLRAAGREG